MPVPQLVQNWPTTPPMTGDPRYIEQSAGDAEAEQIEAPTVAAFTVTPASLKSAADAILTRAGACVASYEAVRAYIEANAHWVFTVRSPEVLTEPLYIAGTDGQAYGPIEPWDQHPEWTQSWTESSEATLLGVAAVVTLAGRYLDMVNNAGQFYTMADENSVMPELPEIALRAPQYSPDAPA